MADSSFRRELVRAALPAAAAFVEARMALFVTDPDADQTDDPSTFAQSCADLAVLIAQRTDEAYSKLVEAEKAIDQLSKKT